MHRPPWHLVACLGMLEQSALILERSHLHTITYAGPGQGITHKSSTLVYGIRLKIQQVKSSTTSARYTTSSSLPSLLFIPLLLAVLYSTRVIKRKRTMIWYSRINRRVYQPLKRSSSLSVVLSRTNLIVNTRSWDFSGTIESLVKQC